MESWQLHIFSCPDRCNCTRLASGMKAELQRILDAWDYEQGLGWFRKHVEGKFFLKEMLTKGPDPYNVKKLKEALYELLPSLPEDTILSSKASESIPKPFIDRTKPPKAVPDKIVGNSTEAKKTINAKAPKVVHQAAESLEEHHLNREWKPRYKEAAYYHSELSEAKSEEENRKLAFQILDTMDEVEALWKKRDFVRQYGVKPDFEFQGLSSLTPTQLLNRRNTLRSYVSKAKKGKLNAEKVPEWDAEIAAVEKLMKL